MDYDYFGLPIKRLNVHSAPLMFAATAPSRFSSIVKHRYSTGDDSIIKLPFHPSIAGFLFLGYWFRLVRLRLCVEHAPYRRLEQCVWLFVFRCLFHGDPMPKNLSSFKWTGVLSFDPNDLIERPELASYIAAITTSWNRVDVELGLLLAAMLGAQAEHAVTIYATLVSSPPLISSLLAIGKKRLNQGRYEELEKLLKKYRKISGKRNDIIHGIWAVAPGVDSGLVYLNPVEDLTFTVSFLNNWSNPEFQDEANKRQYLVYEAHDFQHKLDSIYNIHKELRRFTRQIAKAK